MRREFEKKLTGARFDNTTWKAVDAEVEMKVERWAHSNGIFIHVNGIAVCFTKAETERIYNYLKVVLNK